MERRHADPDRRAQHRALILEHVAAGDVGVDEAARILGLSSRQVGRLLARYADDPTALAHGNRGRAPANRIAEATRAQLVELARTRYAGVNHAHLAELLAEREGIVVAERTLRRILDEAGVAPVRTRRPARHRTRRERMPREGLLLQVDGCRHDWMEGRGPWLTLVGGIDDATSRVTGATFRPAEDAAGYFALFTCDRAPPRCARGRLLGPPRDLRPRAGPGAHPHRAAHRQAHVHPGRARLDDLEIGWIGARSPRRRAGSSGCGARSRAGSHPSSAWRARRRSITRTRSSRPICPATTGASPCRRRIRSPPGGAWRRLPAGVSAESVFCFTVSALGRQRRHPRLGRRAARPPASARRAQLCRPIGRRAGAARRQPVGQPRGRALPARSGATDPSALRSRQLSREAEGKPDLPVNRMTPGSIAGPRDLPSAPARRPAQDHPCRR